MNHHSPSPPFVLFGIDSVFTPELQEAATRSGGQIAAGIVTGEPEWEICGIDPILNEADIETSYLSRPVLIPWVTPKLRFDRHNRALRAGFRQFGTIVHPWSGISSTVEISDAVFVNAGVTVGAHARLGRSALINRSASVGHHTVLEEFVSIGPGATIAARCHIGRGAMIGAGANVGPGVTVGEYSVVGLGAAVIRDVQPNTLEAGIPAREIRASLNGFGGLEIDHT